MAKVAWAALAKGVRLPPKPLELSAAWVQQYVNAVEDKTWGALGERLVPPMAVAALAIRTLLEAVELPTGAIHLGQELIFLGTTKAREKLTVRAQVASSGQRADWILVAIDLRVEDEAGRPVMIGRATVTAPASDKG